MLYSLIFFVFRSFANKYFNGSTVWN